MKEAIDRAMTTSSGHARLNPAQPLDAAAAGSVEHIQEALRMLSTLSVSGDVVDVMAAVKAHLREAERLIEPDKEAEGNG